MILYNYFKPYFSYCMKRKFFLLFLFHIVLLTACIGSTTINVRKNPTVDFSFKNKPVIVALLPSRNYSEHHEIDLPYLDGKLLEKLQDQFDKVRFIPIHRLQENITSSQERELIGTFISKFEKAGMFRDEEIRNAVKVLKTDYFITPSFGANIGVGFSSEWIFTLSIQVYDGQTGKAAFSVTAERAEESIEGFEIQESDLFESVLDDALEAIP